MSFILDALKKSDKERRRGSTPDIYTPQIEPPSFSTRAGRRRRIWIITCLFLALSAAGAMYLLMSANWRLTDDQVAGDAASGRSPAPDTLQSDKTAPPRLTIAPGTSAQPGAAPDTSARQAPQSTGNQVSREAAQPLMPAQSREQSELPEIPESEQTTVMETPPESLSATKKKVRYLPKPQASSVVIAPVEILSEHSDVTPYLELPADIRRELPELKFAGHTYSKTPLSRLIIINNQILREGMTISPDLRLVEITFNGVILDFRGTKFSIRVD